MAGMPITATWDQDSFQWYTDTGAEGTGGYGTGTNPTDLATGTQYRLRYLMQETAGSTSSETPVFEMEYRVDPAGGTSFGAWLAIDSDDSYFTAVSSANVTDGATTTQQIGAGSFNDGEFSFVDATARAPTNAMAATAGSDEYECEWVMNFASASSGANFEFRVTRDTGTALDTYTSTTQVSPPSTEDTLLADDVQSTSEVSSPAVGQTHALLANDVQSTSEVSSPAVGQEHALLANDVESASELSTPTASESHILLANDVESASEVTTPSVGQEHALLANDTESASEVSVPTVGQVHALTANDVQSTAEVSAPALVEVGGVVAQQKTGTNWQDTRTFQSIKSESDENAKLIESLLEDLIAERDAVFAPNGKENHQKKIEEIEEKIKVLVNKIKMETEIESEYQKIIFNIIEGAKADIRQRIEDELLIIILLAA